nr:hypothetical protein [Tanacetum cinerariifolium]
VGVIEGAQHGFQQVVLLGYLGGGAGHELVGGQAQQLAHDGVGQQHAAAFVQHQQAFIEAIDDAAGAVALGDEAGQRRAAVLLQLHQHAVEGACYAAKLVLAFNRNGGRKIIFHGALVGSQRLGELVDGGLLAGLGDVARLAGEAAAKAGQPLRQPQQRQKPQGDFGFQIHGSGVVPSSSLASERSEQLRKRPLRTQWLAARLPSWSLALFNRPLAGRRCGAGRARRARRPRRFRPAGPTVGPPRARPAGAAVAG